MHNRLKKQVNNRRELRDWLYQNHNNKTGIWLILNKKHTENYLPYDDMVEECLCFGWIDGQAQSVDKDRYLRYISPRKKGGFWSQINKNRVEKIISNGIIHNSGLNVIEAAKKDDSWNLLNEIEEGIIPNDLEICLSENKKAQTYFNAFPPSTKKSILTYIMMAKTPETRKKRIKETVEKAADNARIR